MIYGSEQFLKDFEEIGYTPELVKGNDGQTYAVFKEFEIEIGKFSGRVIDLGLLIFPDYPRIVHNSIHVKATPQLFEKTDKIDGVRNILDSGLGSEWRYWSYRFNAVPEDNAMHLMSQINGVFKRA
ncbi:MAG: hypothetical protein A3F91_06910 [Flavobacteria bacterium RIFCSPLOWO2_12_FULL_35_11]|nr:MAG: hypothetical protein A3F91_06910 [Flavobacteria bacterium RIFCSPLOWO2_12_FULL_35_11]